MPAELHETSLIALLAVGFGLALLFGLVASNLKVSPIVGYLIAGICVGPFTPGFVGDSSLASQLAEIGVILLMFGVGLHFSIKDLMSVRYIALPGAVAQIVTATAIGIGTAHVLGWSLGVGIVFGLSLSVASTVVLLRALEERNALQSSEGKIAVGWLIVEDLAMVLARRIVEVGRQLNPAIDVEVRTHSEEEFKTLEALGAGRVVMGERELARGMLEYALRSLGVPRESAQALAGRGAQVNPEGT